MRGRDWQPYVRWQARLRQGYLVSGADGLTLRVRSSDTGAWLTLKAAPAAPQDQAAGPPIQELPTQGFPASGPALSRLEFEYPIPQADAEAMLALCPWQLIKTRYGLDLPGGDWVLDVFEAENAPLVVAEVELQRADQTVALPPWCVRELTGRHDLSNAALARWPLTRWSAEQLQELLSPPDGWLRCSPESSS